MKTYFNEDYLFFNFRIAGVKVCKTVKITAANLKALKYAGVPEAREDVKVIERHAVSIARRALEAFSNHFSAEDVKTATRDLAEAVKVMAEDAGRHNVVFTTSRGMQAEIYTFNNSGKPGYAPEDVQLSSMVPGGIDLKASEYAAPVKLAEVKPEAPRRPVTPCTDPAVKVHNRLLAEGPARREALAAGYIVNVEAAEAEAYAEAAARLEALAEELDASLAIFSNVEDFTIEAPAEAVKTEAREVVAPARLKAIASAPARLALEAAPVTSAPRYCRPEFYLKPEAVKPLKTEAPAEDFTIEDAPVTEARRIALAEAVFIILAAVLVFFTRRAVQGFTEAAEDVQGEDGGIDWEAIEASPFRYPFTIEDAPATEAREVVAPARLKAIAEAPARLALEAREVVAAEVKTEAPAEAEDFTIEAPVTSVRRIALAEAPAALKPVKAETPVIHFNACTEAIARRALEAAEVAPEAIAPAVQVRVMVQDALGTDIKPVNSSGEAIAPAASLEAAEGGLGGFRAATEVEAREVVAEAVKAEDFTIEAPAAVKTEAVKPVKAEAPAVTTDAVTAPAAPSSGRAHNASKSKNLSDDKICGKAATPEELAQAIRNSIDYYFIGHPVKRRYEAATAVAWWERSEAQKQEVKDAAEASQPFLSVSREYSAAAKTGNTDKIVAAFLKADKLTAEICDDGTIKRANRAITDTDLPRKIAAYNTSIAPEDAVKVTPAHNAPKSKNSDDAKICGKASTPARVRRLTQEEFDEERKDRAEFRNWLYMQKEAAKAETKMDRPAATRRAVEKVDAVKQEAATIPAPSSIRATLILQADRFNNKKESRRTVTVDVPALRRPASHELMKDEAAEVAADIMGKLRGSKDYTSALVHMLTYAGRSNRERWHSYGATLSRPTRPHRFELEFLDAEGETLPGWVNTKQQDEVQAAKTAHNNARFDYDTVTKGVHGVEYPQTKAARAKLEAAEAVLVAAEKKAAASVKRAAAAYLRKKNAATPVMTPSTPAVEVIAPSVTPEEIAAAHDEARAEDWTRTEKRIAEEAAAHLAEHNAAEALRVTQEATPVKASKPRTVTGAESETYLNDNALELAGAFPDRRDRTRGFTRAELKAAKFIKGTASDTGLMEIIKATEKTVKVQGGKYNRTYNYKMSEISAVFNADEVEQDAAGDWQVKAAALETCGQYSVAYQHQHEAAKFSEPLQVIDEVLVTVAVNNIIRTERVKLNIPIKRANKYIVNGQVTPIVDALKVKSYRHVNQSLVNALHKVRETGEATGGDIKRSHMHADMVVMVTPVPSVRTVVEAEFVEIVEAPGVLAGGWL